MSDQTTVTDRDVYCVYEYHERDDDSLAMVFEDDADTLQEVIEYYTRLADSDSRIVTGEFHAADPGAEFLAEGDHYLTKRHGVGISHGLCDNRDA